MSFVVHIVPLLLHVVARENLWQQDFNTASGFDFVVYLLGTTLRHLLLGASIQSLLLVCIVALSLPQQCLLLDTKSYKGLYSLELLL